MNNQQHVIWVTMSSVMFVMRQFEAISEVTARVSCMEVLIDQCGSFENGAIFNWKPMQVFEDGCNSRKFVCVGNNSC